MTLAALVLLAAVALLPLLVSLRRTTAARGRREAAVALHREQLAELDRDRAEGRITGAEHAAALLEVQRRLLAADTLEAADASGNRRLPLLAAALAVPAAAFGLYLVHGRPFMAGAPMQARLAAADRDTHSGEMLVAMLRDRLAQPDLDPARAREGFVLLGNTEQQLGHLPEAATAWRQAVRLRFDAGLAALAAEAQTQVEGHVSADSATLFAQALATAPKDAPWRALVADRLKGVTQPTPAAKP